MKRKAVYFVLLVALAVSVFSAEAWGAVSSAKKDYNSAVKKFISVADGKSDAKEVLESFLAIDGSALSDYDRAHWAFYIGDLYFRLGDYEKCKEWTLKVLDDKKLYEAPVRDKNRNLYGHGLTAAAVLANAAAAFGRPEDVDLVESKIVPKDLTTQVFLRYCWTGSPKNSLRAIFRFYKALARKNAGDLNGMREVLAMSALDKGPIWVGTRMTTIAEAKESLLKEP